MSDYQNKDVHVLAVDLDGTFLESKDKQKDDLYAYLREHPECLLVYVTGRNTEVILPILDDMFIPTPNFIIGDVGSTVICGQTLQHIQPLQHDISTRWHETLKDIKNIGGLENLKRQDQPHERRMSFYVDPDDVPHDLIEQLQDRKCIVTYSNRVYLDILPHGAGKGATLRALIDHLEVDHDKVMVAGDTMNDLSMYEEDYKGVVLANAEDPLKEATKDMPNVYFSKETGTDGIFEALKYFEFIDRDTASRLSKNSQKGESDLVMVYHRLPFKENTVDGKTVREKHTSPNGIIPTLLGFFSEKQKGTWLAWSLAESRDPENFEQRVSVDKKLYENLIVRRVPLTKKDVEIFYEVFSKEAFWLLLHSFHEKAVFNQSHWEHFVEINKIFAEKAAEEAAPNAIVWVHDYNLWMLPKYLRQLRPDVKIAFYHHTPFPSADIFNMIPWRREIISSLLQCDYIGFHIPQYVNNFVDTVRSNYKAEINESQNAAPRFKSYGCAIGIDRYARSISTDINTVNLGVHPVGINCKNIENLVKTDKVQSLYNDLRAQIGDNKLVVSIERTDYTKGPVQKLKAYEHFLSRYPDLHGQVNLIMVCTPPAKGMKIYEEITQDIAYNVGLINGRFGTYDWTPIQFVNRMVPFEDVIAYYKAADVCWVTPLRDGLNLVSKEYVIAKQASGKTGALVLSEFAGSAVELHGAHLVNPYDQENMAETLYRGLTATEADKKSRMRRMANITSKYDVNEWGRDFIESVRKSEDKNKTSTENIKVIKAA